MTVKRMDNVGLVVEDLDAAIVFFIRCRRLALSLIPTALLACHPPAPVAKIANGPVTGCYALSYRTWGTPPHTPEPLGVIAPQWISLHDGGIPDSVRRRWTPIVKPSDHLGWLRVFPTDTKAYAFTWERGAHDSISIDVPVTIDAGIGMAMAQEGDSLVGVATASGGVVDIPPATSPVSGHRIPCWPGA